MKNLFTLFLTLALFGSVTHIYAQDLIVSGAGSSDVNGTYVENGTYNGYPKYEYSGSSNNYAIVWECYFVCEGWHIMVDYGGFYDDPSYYTEDGGGTPPSTGWTTSFFAIDPVPSVGLAGPAVSYASSLFREASDNDGSMGNTIAIAHNGFDGNVFAGTNGEDFAATGKATVSNVPAGLTAVIQRVSSTELTFSLTGNAGSHVNTDDISDLTVEFEDAAFSGGVAADIINYLKSNVEVDFIQVLTVASSGADFTSVTAAVAAADDYDEIHISGETFTEVNIIVNKVLTFRGQGADQTIIQGNALPNTASDRVFSIVIGLSYTKFYDLTVQHGYRTGSNHGGGIFTQSNIEMHRCAIRSNTINNSGGGGGIACLNSDYAVFNACLFANNTCTSTNSARGGGMLVGLQETCTITNCTFTGNVLNGTNDEVGGGLLAENGDFIINNSTFTGNEASTGRAGGIYTQKNTSFQNVICYGNTAATAADFYRQLGTTNASNCIIGSSAAQSGAVINGTSSNVSSSNPLLQALADNGGPTQTHALGAGSPAINTGLAGVTSTDQRGFYKNGVRDIGAYEYDAITNVWNGGEDADWATAGNWADGTVPTAGEDVAIASGTYAPEIPGTAASPTQVGQLFVLEDANLVIGAGKALTATGATNNDGTILVKADATGIGSLITEGTISGTGASQMEQYLTGSGGATPNGIFHYVGSPVTGGEASGFDLASGNKLWVYSEAADGYTQITNGATTLAPLAGHAVRVGSNASRTLAGTSFNTGTQSANLSRTGTSSSFRGYHLVSNPYPSTVSWDNATRNNLETTIWYRTNQTGTMVFDTYNATGGVGTNNNGNGSVTGNIPPGQAVWMRVDADGNTGELSFSNANRSHGTLASIYKTEAQEGLVRMVLSNGTNSDEVILLFDTDAQDGFDDYDSRKYWANNLPQFYMNVAEDTLTINGLYSTATNSVVDLGMKLLASGDYSLNANEITVVGEPVYLEDRMLNVFQDLSANPNYSFSSASGNIGDRFALHFGMTAVGIENGVEASSHVYATENQLNIILSENTTSGNVEVLDMAGRVVFTSRLNASRNTLDLNVKTGVYLIRVETANGTDTHKIYL